MTSPTKHFSMGFERIHKTLIVKLFLNETFFLSVVNFSSSKQRNTNSDKLDTYLVNLFLLLKYVPLWQRTLKKLRTLKKKFSALWIFFSKCVKFGTNLTHFDFFFQSALRVYINITFDVNLNALWKKNIDEVKLLALCSHLIDGVFKC